MDIRKEHLLRILEENGHKVALRNDFHASLNKLVDGDFYQEAQRMYTLLGGIQVDFPRQLLNWDFVIDRVPIAFDDLLHFNRYRAITLQASLYDVMPWFPVNNYRRYCRTFEKECLKGGTRNGIWINKASEQFFGSSSEPADLYGSGPSGWKLLAFNAFLSDLISLKNHQKVVRISVYDTLMVNGSLIRMDKMLESGNSKYKPYVINYINRLLKKDVKPFA